jgi:hypothetical protein
MPFCNTTMQHIPAQLVEYRQFGNVNQVVSGTYQIILSINSADDTTSPCLHCKCNINRAQNAATSTHSGDYRQNKKLQMSRTGRLVRSSAYRPTRRAVAARCHRSCMADVDCTPHARTLPFRSMNFEIV